MTLKILWKHLKGENVTIIKEQIGLERRYVYEGDVNQIWNQLVGTIKDVTRDTLGIT